MNIAPEGIKLVIVGAVIAGIGFLASSWCRITGIGLASLGLLFTLFSVYFFRDPERNRQFTADEIVCPADGTVLSIRNEGDPSVQVLRIFLSVFNVHIQRSPLAGEVESIVYTKGTFAVAYKPEASTNERNRIRIKSADGRFAEVEQITGAIARRIACRVKKGQTVKEGERIGIIYFGSQVALYLPSSAKITVKPGDKVSGAETVVGTWK